MPFSCLYRSMFYIKCVINPVIYSNIHGHDEVFLDGYLSFSVIELIREIVQNYLDAYL